MQTIIVTIPVRNKKNTSVTVTIGKGTVIQTSGPNDQHVVVAEDATVTLGPLEERDVLVKAYCLNRDRRWPKKSQGSFSGYSVNMPFATQDDVWDNVIGRPDIYSDPLMGIVYALRQWMIEYVSLASLEIVAVDLGAVWDNIPGSTISDKAFGLVRSCEAQSKLMQLVWRLQDQFPGAQRLVDIQDRLDALSSPVAAAV